VIKFWWKLRFAVIMMFIALVPWGVAWMIADSYEESFGIDDSPSDAVDNEISCWDE
jgi:hypothetical protein